MPTNKHFGTYISSLRRAADLSQEVVAEQINVSRPTYTQIEKGERDLTVSEAKHLTVFFDVPLDMFLAMEVPKGPTVTITKKSKTHSKVKDISNVRIDIPQEKVDIFKEVLLYILNKVGARPNIGETAIYKLLYFIDFDYYEKYEEQLIGATYIKNHYGPTPVMFKKIVDDMAAHGEIEKVQSTHFTYKQKKYLPLRSPNLSRLSARDIKHIDEVLERLGNKRAKDLSDYSHEDIPWKSHAMGEPIAYESVFYRDDLYSVKEYGDEL